ncbi:hypothetical protein MTR67_005977 [Solanum verrucosum]|uniref:Uncharacterized protein n=1 Tax=Solanum verrucosum TaxID=315347 RepID=A0AAF0T985_SOLVR|nr:hypothetical protein MTR67_005977 [Solanum verrucosum]
MGVSHSYELRLAQSWWRWKDRSKSFPTMPRSTPNSS